MLSFVLMIFVQQFGSLEVSYKHASYRRVSGGDEIEPPHSKPWLVYLPGLNLENPVWNMGPCTGSIIGKRHVLTAKHCVWGIPDPKYAHVVVGAHDYRNVKKGIGQKIGIEKFNRIPMNYSDIAVVALVVDLPLNNDSHIKKAILAPPSNSDCTLCTGECSGKLDVSGWGIDPISNPVEPHESYVPRTTTKICRKCSYLTPTRPTYLTERNKMCAISDKIDKYNTSCDMFDACLGDSGGPLAKSGTNVIVGILHGGKGIYTDLLRLVAQEFIVEIVKDLEIEGGILQLFSETDTNSNGLVSEYEALNSVNKVNAWRWTHQIEIMPMILLNRMRYHGITYKEFTDCVVLLNCTFRNNIP